MTTALSEAAGSDLGYKRVQAFCAQVSMRGRHNGQPGKKAARAIFYTRLSKG